MALDLGLPGVFHETSNSVLFSRVSDEEKKTSTCIWVGNLPYNSTESDIREMFEKYGQLTRVTVPMDRTGQRNKGFAFVEFETRKEAEDAYDKVEGLVGVKAKRSDTWENVARLIDSLTVCLRPTEVGQPPSASGLGRGP